MKKTYKKILSVILCLCFFLSVPSTVYASEKQLTVVNDVWFSYGPELEPTRFVHFENKPFPCTLYNGSISQIGYVDIQFDVNISANKDDVLNVRLKQSETHYPDYFACSERCYITVRDKSDNYIDIAEGEAYYQNGYFIYEDVSIPEDCTITFFNFSFNPQKLEYKEGWQNNFVVRFTLEECTVTVDSESKGFFNSIKEFFTQLFDKLTNGLSDIGSWFSDLKNNIGDFFSELGTKLTDGFTDVKNNLKEWFKNVGDWFSSLGDSIGGFFTNLWNNITDKVNGITDSVKEWWQSVIDFFHSLFVPEDGYFESYKENWNIWFNGHFGFLADAIYYMNEFFDLLDFDSWSRGRGTVTIPEIRLPFLDNPVLLPETNWNFSSLVSSKNQFIYYAYSLYQTCVEVICSLAIFKFGIKTFNKVVGVEDD